jgi:hypothetical protein
MELRKAVEVIAEISRTRHNFLSNLTDIVRFGQSSVDPPRAGDYGIDKMCVLLSFPGIGEAINQAFRIMANVAIGLDVVFGSDGNIYRSADDFPDGVESVAVSNVFLKKGVKAKDLDGGFLDPIRDMIFHFTEFSSFAEVAVEVARMLFETSFLSGFYGVKRDPLTGNIVYKDENGIESHEFDSDSYRWGVATVGSGTLYGGKLSDFVKYIGPRIRQIKE